jgi:hypothetical protein
MAIENDFVRADAIAANEFPELSDRYAVYAVPLTIVNDSIRVEGGMPEAYFVPQVLQKLDAAKDAG